jgi:hypothetical protein
MAANDSSNPDGDAARYICYCENQQHNLRPVPEEIDEEAENKDDQG